MIALLRIRVAYCIVALTTLWLGPLPGQAADEHSRLVAGHNAAGVGLYRELANRPGNLVLSPLSVALAMSMALSAARGATEKQLSDVIVGGLARDRMELATKRRLEELDALAKEGKVRLEFANSLHLTKPDSTLSQSYRALVAENFRSAIFEGADVGSVNRWVHEKTGGKIPSILDRLSPESAAVLLNAIHFNGAWARPFDPKLTRNEPFHLAGGVTVSVPMMHEDDRFSIVEKNDFKALALPYAGGAIELLILLPDRIDGLSQLEAVLDRDLLDEVQAQLAKATPSQVDLALPRFKSSFRDDLVAPFRKLGIEDAFSGKANFTGLFESAGAGGHIQIDQVAHKALIEITEEGTEAAAATAVTMSRSTARPQSSRRFSVEHPFLYLIVERSSRAILFIGRLVDPRQAD